MADALRALGDAGVSIWLDDLSREQPTSGGLAELGARDHVMGVTTNPSIFAKAISGGSDGYAGQLADLGSRGVGVGQALQDLTTFGARLACDVLRDVYDATDGVDGRVSIEVDPGLARDTPATIAEARAPWWASVADHGAVPADPVRGHYAEAHEVLDRLAALGVDYDDVVTTLEDEAVTKFDAAWADLADQLVRRFG